MWFDHWGRKRRRTPTLRQDSPRDSGDRSPAHEKRMSYDSYASVKEPHMTPTIKTGMSTPMSNRVRHRSPNTTSSSSPPAASPFRLDSALSMARNIGQQMIPPNQSLVRQLDFVNQSGGKGRSPSRSTFRQIWGRPRKWTLTTLVVMVVVVSSLCSIFMSTLSLFWWSSSLMSEIPPRYPVMSVVGEATPKLRRRGDGSPWWDRRNQVSPPRIYFLDGVWDPSEEDVAVTRMVDGTMMFSLQNTTTDIHDDWQPRDYNTSDCQPMAEWQTQSFPTCNSFHEIHLHAAMPEAFNEELSLEEELTALGQGWFRTTWKWDRMLVDAEDSTESLVLKTLRMEREYKREYYELHRRDTVAMERLTRSSFVVNVYGSCGNSAINELANFPFPGVQSLEVFNRKLRGRDQTPGAYIIKLRMAASVAVGLADIHGIDSDTVPSMAHYDVNPRNIALFAGGKPKLNDFNIAEFLHYHKDTGEVCGFPARLHEPWWRGPEEMNISSNKHLVDEKVDIYALGNILFHTLTTHSPRGKMKAERIDEVRSIVAQGIPPVIPPPYDTAMDPCAVAIRHAMELCFKQNPTERASAADIAEYLTHSLINITRMENLVEEEKEEMISSEDAKNRETEDTDNGDSGEDEIEVKG